MQNGSVSDFGYTNNAIGNRTAMSRAGSAFTTPDTISYSYNSRSEVIGAVSNQNSVYNYAYNFDPIGNRLTANLAGTSYNYTANMLNQYTVVNSNQPTYDDDGNMLTNGNWTYTWNGENRMVQAVNGNTKLQFVYDYMGRRVEKKVFDGDTVVSHKRFVYDDYKQVEELDALNSNSVLKRYSWQPEAVGLDVPLSMTDVATAKNYAYTLDANKNVSDLTDAQGNIVAHYEYSPFGTHVATGSYTGNPFRFSSEVFDSETGLIYYNYRYYNPNLGRWINRDPIEEQGGWNLYTIVQNCTVNIVDALGFFGDGQRKAGKGDQLSIQVKFFDGNSIITISFGLEPIPRGHSDFDQGDVFDFTKPDNGIAENPFTPWGIDKHFQDRKKAQDRVDAAIKSCKKDAYERAMHSLQDSFSHHDAGFRSYPFHGWHPKHWFPGHLGAGTVPDNNETAWIDANKLTKQNNQKWDKTCCKCGDEYNRRSEGPCD